ncbi:hypothetical protein, partial [Verminephrobacter aporrectodeae]
MLSALEPCLVYASDAAVYAPALAGFSGDVVVELVRLSFGHGGGGRQPAGAGAARRHAQAVRR